MGADRWKVALLAIALAGLALGLGSQAAARPDLARLFYAAGVLPVLAGLLMEILRSLREKSFGLDIIAALSMSSALAVGESLAASVVAVMYAGGTLLESFAEGRARREMQALLARVPRTATIQREGRLVEIALDGVMPGDHLLIRRGDVVPVDGRVLAGPAVLDTATLTGETLPVKLGDGAEVMSGASNVGDAFTLLAARRAQDSTYAGIVRLVEAAQRSRAPMARLADRWSLGFLALTLLIAAAAYAATGEATRVVAVLVVATPCPLILAVPVALVAGLSRAAALGVLVKGAGPLEAMTRVRTLILDKTGTLTDGRPDIVAIEGAGMAPDEMLRLAAALEQASKHPMAQALVRAARGRGLVLPLPEAVTEQPGDGLAGRVEGHEVVVGGHAFVCAQLGLTVPPPARVAGAVLVAVGLDGALAGHIVMADALRAGLPALLAGLRAEGIARILLATGDRQTVAEQVAGSLGLDRIAADLTPDGKVALVQAEKRGGPVMMVGDGVNDAPALAAADVGVAMGARGAAASAEAADVVLLVDRLDRLAAGIEIARGARRIALQSVVAGIGLSTLGMIAAAFGLLVPVEGALLQEAIDVAVILNALRALRLRP